MKTSLLKGLSDLVTMATYSIPKCSDDTYIKNIVTSVMGSEPKPAMERLRVLKPPVAQTLKVWQMASNAGIPASRYDRNASTFSPR